MFPPSHQVWRQHINSNCSLVLLEALWFTHEWEVLMCECLHSASLLTGIQSCSKDKLSCFHIMNNGSPPHFQWYMNDRTAHLHWMIDNGKWYFTPEAKDDETERWLRDTLACGQKKYSAAAYYSLKVNDKEWEPWQTNLCKYQCRHERWLKGLILSVAILHWRQSQYAKVEFLCVFFFFLTAAFQILGGVKWTNMSYSNYGIN